jgi:hypothetical protein
LLAKWARRSVDLPMSRDAHIPIFLWVATAALVHILWGFEADNVATLIESRNNVRRFAESVRQHVRLENSTQEFEIVDEADFVRATVEDNDNGLAASEEKEAPEQEDLEPERKPNESDERAVERDQKLTPSDKSKPLPTEPEPPKPETKKPDEKRPLEAQILQQEAKRRVAVEQHAAENQPDNPNADHIAERANHVDKETQSRITSSDQNDPSPNPGTNTAPPSSDPGNARLSEMGQSDDAPGDPNLAPAESKEDGKDEQSSEAQAAARAGQLAGGEPARASDGDQAEATRQAKAESRGQKASTAQAATPAQSELATAESGVDSVAGPSEERKLRQGKTAVRAQKRTPNARKSVDLGGFGSMNTTPGGLNPNLNPASALSVIGADRLARERRADGERRRSKHRGSWTSVGLERWRSAIENYVATVQPGNQTALNTAASPFAAYLNRIHQRLHPQFADEFLNSLDGLPRDHEMNQDLRTFLEIVLSREDGRLVRMGVTRASGSTAFDVGALEAVQRSGPFGAPPSAIVSPDGNVYLHWEFHRNPVYACSTYNARPYMLRVAPTPAPSPPLPAPPAEPAEGQRHGKRDVPSTKQDG